MPVDRRFTMPKNGNRVRISCIMYWFLFRERIVLKMVIMQVFWYSYDYGSAHMVSISSEHDLHPNSDQYVWLERDLESVNRDITPWLVVTSHRPLYEPELIPSELITIRHIREEIEELMYKFKVDLFLSGHYHSYFRSCAGLFRGKCHNFGTQYITVGTGGANLFRGTQTYPYLVENDWTKSFHKIFGYGRVSIFSSTSLYWEFIDTDGKVIDDVWIKK